MPDQPAPYNMRDWKTVAIRYDSFIYDKNKTGQYLPLVSFNANAVNYPSQKQIRLHTYVGTNSPQNSEGINVLPSLVGAALVGQDIRYVYGQDRLVMAQDFFNKLNGENIYLNNASSGSGGDWWYDVMPNVYYYQLYDLFPDFNPEATKQFLSIANIFLEATKKMGGKATPWTPSYMNYRAWNFKTMEGNSSGVKEPEAAGTFAWLLYHAYKKTNNKAYLKGAEWSMEYLNSLGSNPSYELQLPYGAYIAAKMNAEAGTNYDTEKLINWCFNRGPLRGWGTIVGKWGGMDVSGLVGEANDAGNDYAFVMNGMQLAAALVPMVRYDKRYAKAIGKWMLNLSNASRLFYPGYLQSSQQDGALWSQTNDAGSVIAHEAMKQKFQNISPYATGDALAGGWASTNLAIYGSSSVGYLGAIVSKTNVDRILKLDLNATDFYSDAAYPSFLYYNPYDTPKSVFMDAGNDQYDIYETLSETFIHQGKTGTVSIIIPPKEAMVVVVAPSGGVISYERNKTLIQGVVVDFNQKKVPFSYSPRIKALEAADIVVEKGKSVPVFCTAVDLDSDSLQYFWNSDRGTFIGNGSLVNWSSPTSTGIENIKVIVKDLDGNSDSMTIQITVVDVINKAPVIENIKLSARYCSPQETIVLECQANDENNDVLNYSWTAEDGQISGTGNVVMWKAPEEEGIYTVKVKVDDGKGLFAEAQTSLLVKDFNGTGNLIAWYPFSGNANDISGNEHSGVVKGAILTADFSGNVLSSYYFNGGSQHIEVANKPKLNFQDGISLSLWFKPSFSGDKETFLLSHGSWQNRYKLSITPSGNLRWTINTIAGIADLDSEIVLKKDSIYHVVASYDGTTMMVNINGNLNSFKSHTGKIRTTTLPFLMGQMLPSDAAYNYKGIMDEIRIYDFAIHPDDVQSLFSRGVSTSVPHFNDSKIAASYPNPTGQVLYLRKPDYYSIVAQIRIVDIQGRQVAMFRCQQEYPQEIDVSMLTPGTYYLQLINDSGTLLQSSLFIKS